MLLRRRERSWLSSGPSSLGDVGFEQRAELLRDWQASLRISVNTSPGSSLEMGKPLAQAEAEVDKCAWVCRYFAESVRLLRTERFS